MFKVYIYIFYSFFGYLRVMGVIVLMIVCCSCGCLWRGVINVIVERLVLVLGCLLVFLFKSCIFGVRITMLEIVADFMIIVCHIPEIRYSACL